MQLEEFEKQETNENVKKRIHEYLEPLDKQIEWAKAREEKDFL
jgi:hypothetical protein